ncbi:MAG: GNAT family N-acetyltransferase [Acidobacteriota bacterium]
MSEAGGTISIRPEPLSALVEHARISIAFDVTSRLEVELLDSGLGGMTLRERPVATPWRKDYDVVPGHAPTDWPRRFDVSRWGLLTAFDGEERVGGCVLAHDTPGLHVLEGRPDTAELWDLRVAPEHRGRGIGSRLFEAVREWARERGCRRLRIETQDINVPACRFYAARGCELAEIRRGAYPELPDETELVWALEL